MSYAMLMSGDHWMIVDFFLNTVSHSTLVIHCVTFFTNDANLFSTAMCCYCYVLKCLNFFLKVDGGGGGGGVIMHLCIRAYLQPYKLSLMDLRSVLKIGKVVTSQAILSNISSDLVPLESNGSVKYLKIEHYI